MRIFLFSLLFSLCVSCQNKSNNQSTSIEEPTVASKEPEETVLNTTYCFRLTAGASTTFQDTTLVQLTVIGNEVMGQYDWIPAGKDSARGSLTGTVKNGIITAIYDYVIEGSKQKEEMIFKLEVNQLLVKKGALMEVDGILKLKNPAEAKFTEILPRVLCK